MNKRINRLIFDIGLVMAIMFGVLSCTGESTEPYPPTIPTPAGYGWSKKTYDGHTYIFVDGFKSDCIVHDPDCPCSKK